MGALLVGLAAVYVITRQPAPVQEQQAPITQRPSCKDVLMTHGTAAVASLAGTAAGAPAAGNATSSLAGVAEACKGEFGELFDDVGRKVIGDRFCKNGCDEQHRERRVGCAFRFTSASRNQCYETSRKRHGACLHCCNDGGKKADCKKR